MNKPLSPNDVRALRAALVRFNNAYVAYLQTPSPDTRSGVIRAIPEAETALLVGGGGYTFTDPPAMGSMRQSYSGLGQTAFLHEQFGWEEVHGRPPYELVLEGVQRADAVLELEERRAVERDSDEVRRRRHPLYWADRAVRAALTVPAYIVSVIVGEDPETIDRSAWGMPLRVLAIVADIVTVYLAGRAFGLW